MQNESISSPGAIVRRFSGPAADEIYFQCGPPAGESVDIGRQAASIYQALDSLLRCENGGLEQIVSETVFFRNIREHCLQFQEARREAFRDLTGKSSLRPAATFIEQPPLDTDADVVVSAIAVLPRRGSPAASCVAGPACARWFALGNRKFLFAGNIQGRPGPAFEQAHSMFCQAEDLLAQESMTFRDVIRTWIYLRKMERDYSEFNRARREFFRQREVKLLPASTGIYGSPFSPEIDFALALQAIKGPQPLATSAMATPTLNEASAYGSDFSRGLRVMEANKIGLYVSGTASVDEEGRTAHAGNFAAQVERMLLNVETLLAAQEAGFRDVVAARTYLKTPDDTGELQRILSARGLDDLPNVVVQAEVCRPDLLCEMEALAVLPLP